MTEESLHFADPQDRHCRAWMTSTSWFVATVELRRCIKYEVNFAKTNIMAIWLKVTP
jgi:hypothetical protein